MAEILYSPTSGSSAGIWTNADNEKRPENRIFVNRTLQLEKIKFYGFDMDYTLAEYKAEEYETLGFELVKERLIQIGYPKEISEFQYNRKFPVRGLWWDNLHGNLLKVDGFGNILYACHGLKFLKAEEISAKYPNKFIQLDDSRIYVYNTLFNLPETYLIACVMNYFLSHSDYQEMRDGFKCTSGSVHLSYKSIFSDVRGAVDYVHIKGNLKAKTCENLAKYIKKDDRLPQVLHNIQKSGAKTFLLTNSEWEYTDKVMHFLLDFPDAPHAGKPWQSYFNYTFVDARKPRFFNEGSVLRRVNKETGHLSIGGYVGDELQEMAVYSGGNCEVLSKLIGARGKDVLYVGDHIFGDVVKSKKIRGWRTFLIVPELNEELNVWTSKQELWQDLERFDQKLSLLYRDMGQETNLKPNVAAIKTALHNTIHSMEMSYGTCGSLFRSGSRQTFFASQVVRFADIYSASLLNLLYYPTFFMFRSPAMLLPHESTVPHLMPRSDADTSEDHVSETKRLVETGQVPGTTHDMDDDDIDYVEESETCSDQSN